MSLDFDYSRDTEFSKLLARRSDVNLTTAALELARDAYPKLEFQPVLDWVHARSKELRSAVARTHSEREALELVANTIAIEHGVTGDPEAYELAESSYLNRVIETGRGIPITLSLLYMAVCRDLHLKLRGVAAPQRFVTRLETMEGTLFQDSFDRGRVMTEAETVSWLMELTRFPKREIVRSLKPAEPRTIVTRMLNNLKTVHLADMNWSALWKVQCRLTALSPSDYAERRDLAVTAVRVDQSPLAIRLLKELLLGCPADEETLLKSMLRDAESQTHQWN